MSVRRIGTTAALLSALLACSAFAQDKPAATKPAASTSLKGTWVGFSMFNGDQRQAKFIFDSTSTGWSGATLIPEMGADSIYFDKMTVKKDSVSFLIPFGADAVGVRGAYSGNYYSADLIVQGAPMGTLRMARAGTAEAAQLLTPPLQQRH
ncbi:MAG TPA: hypothetical protein VGM82_11630 [Gemmatimonadaceae bacterium]|jgi:hypothetical protein